MRPSRFPLVALFAFGACKHSGVAITGDGRALSLNIEVPTDLSEGATEELKVEVRNSGVNRMKDVVFEVEMPNELIILSTVPAWSEDLPGDRLIETKKIYLRR